MADLLLLTDDPAKNALSELAWSRSQLYSSSLTCLGMMAVATIWE